jgi:dihydroorotase
MLDLIIRGGEVLTTDGPVLTDVGIKDGVVAALGDNLGDAGATIDADGTWVGPGFVDLHAHLREPGQEWKEDIGSGSAAAAAGGYTAIVAMPNTDPVIDSGHLARFVSDRGKQVGIVDVIPSGCLTMRREGKTMSHIDELWEAGVRLFTDDGDTVGDAAVLRLVMEYVAQYGGVVSQHAVDPSLSRAGHMHEGAISSRLGMYAIPSEADEVVIARDLALARLTGVRYHVQHLSTAGSVALVASAKAEGLPVTAEVTPHHLMFSHADVASTDSNFKMMPPLRSEIDRDALIEGLESGIIDAVATDHAPHAALEKEVPFEDAPNGVLGLEWAASVVTTMTDLGMADFFERMSIAPARILGLADHGQRVAPGHEANLVVYQPGIEWSPAASASKSRNAPYFGRSLTGAPVATILRGVASWERA